MKIFVDLITLIFVVVVAQSSAHAMASASVSVSDITCSHFAASGALISTSIKPSFSASFIGPSETPVYWDPTLSLFASGCSDSLFAGEMLMMSALASLEVSDQGRSGAMGGEYSRLPYCAPCGGVASVPSGFELAYAAAAIDSSVDPRQLGELDYRVNGDVSAIQTIQDAVANTFTSTGIIQGIAVPRTDDSHPWLGYPVYATIFLQVNAWAVSGIPEPSTYAMLLAGLGLLGLVARRNKRIAA